MGFIIQFYIIFGTNLLTGGPTHIAIFLPISVCRRKGCGRTMRRIFVAEQRSKDSARGDDTSRIYNF